MILKYRAGIETNSFHLVKVRKEKSEKVKVNIFN